MNTISRILGPSITLVVSTCWRFSCLGLGGQIFEIEPALPQCITNKTWRYTATLLLIYW